MTMIGELDLAQAGRNAQIQFNEDTVLIRFPDYRTAIGMVWAPMPSLDRLGVPMKFGSVVLKAQIGDRRPLELFPKPHWIVNLLSPSVRRMIAAAK